MVVKSKRVAYFSLDVRVSCASAKKMFLLPKLFFTEVAKSFSARGQKERKKERNFNLF